MAHLGHVALLHSTLLELSTICAGCMLKCVCYMHARRVVCSELLAWEGWLHALGMCTSRIDRRSSMRAGTSWWVPTNLVLPC